VIIYADDLGWADAGAHGSTFHRTPNIDRLAARGMRFTQAYAAAPNLLALARRPADGQAPGANLYPTGLKDGQAALNSSTGSNYS